MVMRKGSQEVDLIATGRDYLTDLAGSEPSIVQVTVWAFDTDNLRIKTEVVPNAEARYWFPIVVYMFQVHYVCTSKFCLKVLCDFLEFACNLCGLPFLKLPASPYKDEVPKGICFIVSK